MEIKRFNLDNCAEATGLVVVIDVLRAFTTAGCLFELGVNEILMAGSIEDARSIRARFPNYLLLGEVDGIKIPDFDLGNSPSLLEGLDLNGVGIIQRTTAGTQGVIGSIHASQIVVAALTNGSATCRYIRDQHPERVSLIETGRHADWGDEDVACADFLESILSQKVVDLSCITQRVIASKSGLHYSVQNPEFPPDDLRIATYIDRFDFVMVVQRDGGLFRVHKEN
jgi:2-phosphosulfolactate phosphatase